METGWMAEGKCRDMDPAIFFPSDGVGVLAAQSICADCHVKVDCLEYTLADRVDTACGEAPRNDSAAGSCATGEYRCFSPCDTALGWDTQLRCLHDSGQPTSWCAPFPPWTAISARSASWHGASLRDRSLPYRGHVDGEPVAGQGGPRLRACPAPRRGESRPERSRWCAGTTARRPPDG